MLKDLISNKFSVVLFKRTFRISSWIFWSIFVCVLDESSWNNICDETISFMLFKMFVHYMSFDLSVNNKSFLNWIEYVNTSTWCRFHGVLWRGFYEKEQDDYTNIIIWLILSMLWDINKWHYYRGSKGLV